MKYKTINTVGTGYSGASAIYEYLQKTNKFYDPFPNSQFSISYDPGGLQDLENIIRNQFTINKSKQAYDNFKDLINFYCAKNKSFKTSKNFTKFNKDIHYLLKNFLNNIVSLKYHGETTFMNYKTNFYKSLKFKILGHLFKYIGLKRSNKEILFILCDIVKFEEEVRKLIFELFEKNNFERKNIILEQAGTIFNPITSLKYFSNPYCLCVLRDPRDIYTELKRKGYKFPGYNKEIFCDWYIKILEKINNEERLNKKVLFLNFEDFVIKKQDTISKIFNHIESEQIEFNKVDFNFSRCENNINVFKKELNKNEIEYIEKKLKTFLYPF